MRRIPMTAKEQLLLAREHGHELSVLTRTRPDFPDAPPKYFVTCTCGYKGKAAARSKVGANFYLAGHLGKVISEILDEAAPPRASGS